MPLPASLVKPGSLFSGWKSLGRFGACQPGIADPVLDQKSKGMDLLAAGYDHSGTAGDAGLADRGAQAESKLLSSCPD